MKKNRGYRERFTINELLSLAGDYEIMIEPLSKISDINLLSIPKEIITSNKAGFKVPLRVALFYYKRGKAQLVPPKWLSVNHLEKVLESENKGVGDFERLPFYYYCVGMLFMQYAKSSLPEPEKIQHLLKEIVDTRKGKLMNNLKEIDFGKESYRINLSHLEINLIREHLADRLKIQKGFKTLENE